jgi:DNA processing protein
VRHRALALAFVDGVGPRTYHDLIARFGSAEEAFDALPAPSTAVAEGRAVATCDESEARGVRVVSWVDPDYPGDVRHLRDAPPVLFARGNLSLPGGAGPGVAIVGSRDATAYGMRVTRSMAGALARAGACIISGLARGVDAEAHRSALDAHGTTVAVLGTGVDVPYPVAHRALQERIAHEGLLLSEWPCGTRAAPGSFPRRNRIIAALARAVLITEAGVRSGALITATHALDLARTVAAVPGAIDSPASAGTNLLIRDGAVVVLETADALMLAGLSEPSLSALPSLAPDAGCERVLAVVRASPGDCDALAVALAMPVREVLSALTRLEIAGSVEQLAGGEYRATMG